MKRTSLRWRSLLCGLSLLLTASCGGDSTRSAPSPTIPKIESLESASETVHPGDSVQLAVVGGPKSNISGDTGTLSQALSHDGGVADSGGSPDAIGATDAGPPADIGTDAGSPADTGSDTGSPADSGTPADTGTTGDAGAPADTGTSPDAGGDPKPDPPEGNVPEGWTVEWTVDNDDWSIEGSNATATLTAPDRYDSTVVVEVTVVTPDDNQASETIRIGTGSNAAPAIVGTSARPNPVEPGGNIDVSVDASDSRGDELSYDWNIDSPWTVTDSSAGSATIAAPDEEGAFASLTVTVSDDYGGQTSTNIRLETKQNGRPALSSVTATPPQVAPGGTITLEASATDPEGADLTYSWTVPQNWTASSTSGATIDLQAPSTYAATGRAEVVVEDPRGATASGAVVVSTNENQGPTIASFSASPASVAKGGTIDLAVDASDPNGDSLSYSWSVQNNTKWTLNTSGSTATLQSPDEPSAQTRIQVTVEDTEGKKAQASTVVSTQPNRTPTIASVSANPGTVAPGQTSTVTVSASDPDGDSLGYSWTATGNWSVSGSGTTATVTAPSSNGVQGTVRVTVDDGFGGTATGSAALSTEQNQDPVLSSLTANPPSVAPGGNVQVQATASDPNGHSLTYSWNVPQGWSKSGSGNQITLTAPTSPGKSGLVRVTVDDGHGGSVKGSTLVSTDQNQAPVLSTLTATPSSVAPGGTIDVIATASDPDGDSLNFSWNTPKGWSKSGSGNKITVTAPGTPGQSGVIGVTIDDGHGGSAKGSTTVSTEKNAAPVLSALTANPSSVAPGGTVKVEAFASDPNGNSLTYSWTVPQGWSKSGSGATITLTAPGSYGKRGTVKVDVDDGNGGKTSGSVVVETSRNQSPIISNVTASPAVLDPGATSTLEVTAADPNGDPLNYSWSVPAGWTTNGSGKQITVTAPNTKDASATVTVTVDDGQGGSSSGAVGLQTHANRAPTITSLNANPTTVSRKGSSTITASVTDPEGDNITYSWTVSPGWSKSGSGKQITVTAPNQYGENGIVKLVASDGQDQDSSTVVVRTEDNKSPTVNSLTANPSTVTIDSGSTVKVDASDPLGDSLNYSWSLSDQAWTRTGSGKTITVYAPDDPNSSTDVTVTVTDGHGGSVSKSVTVTAKDCSSGKANCDGSGRNGCEVNTNTDGNNCGSCGNTCTGNKVCSSGTCTKFQDVYYKCSGDTGYVVFAQNVQDKTINSYQDVVDACKAYGFKALGTSHSSQQEDKGWGKSSNNQHMNLAVKCHNCYWRDGGYPFYYDKDPNGNSCSHERGVAQKGEVAAGFVANARRTNLNCVTFKQKTTGTKFGDNESGDANEPWYDASGSVDNDPNCDRLEDTADKKVYTGTPDYIMCSSASLP